MSRRKKRLDSMAVKSFLVIISDYCFNLGSNASVSPSPIRLKIVTVTKMATPGNTANHHALIPASREAFKSEPQVTCSGGTPTPINERNDSVKIADAIPKAIAMSTGANEVGIACLKIILYSL